jgi:ABC-type multidrug transport system ATPase subunit
VGLARALLAPGKILILDETLSGLDEQSAMIVLSNLRREMGGTRTVIACTSLPHSLRGAFETIAVMHAGRIATGGVGSHQQLASSSIEYGKLLDPAAAAPRAEMSSSGSSLQQQTSTISSVGSEAVWKKRLQLADELEDNILQLGMQQGQVLQMVEVVTEIKEALGGHAPQPYTLHPTPSTLNPQP